MMSNRSTWTPPDVVHLAEEGASSARARTRASSRASRPPASEWREVDEVYLLRVEDGKFVDLWGLEDDLNRMRQLGLVPSPEQS
jgi:hypothetical protein